MNLVVEKNSKMSSKILEELYRKKSSPFRRRKYNILQRDKETKKLSTHICVFYSGKEKLYYEVKQEYKAIHESPR